ncbi:GLPGLI family protein [Flavobacterium subsaxonicum]|uniref:Peptide-N-glycosidase n=1 Tax=Flavobacterium subsaxonicum WB 4.1-42 = DSM 21790 TaxID=1121898 RepID=A0A0A2MSC3_9FLAO|nr:GLPGLI family protein [Flavobacterium subsaxonicum]KGO94358.1 peptide-N-glycosidase [Flavobacterium subsaxonicum WB 4.1-42 = DSM 21790]
MKTFFAILLLLPFFSFAQKQPKAIKVTYQKAYLGTVNDANNPTILFSDGSKALVTSKNILDKKAPLPTEQTIVSHNNASYIQLAQLSNSTFVAAKDSTSVKKQKLELLPDTKTILGYKCHKAKTIINSNTIEIWYTNDLGLKGAPSVLGIELGLVLETVRNNNFVVTATKVEKLKDASAYLNVVPTNTKMTDGLTYRDLLWKARFTTISVFKDQVLNFSDESKSNDSVMRFANGTIALRKIKFPEVKTGSQVFLDLTEQSNGDAYDRTGSVFIIPEDQKQSFLDGLKNGINTLPLYDNGNGKKYQGIAKTDNYTPLLELMRFFTPFGVKQYNHIELKDKVWQQAVPYRQDISELAPSYSGKEVWVGVFIGNYDKGGHKISMDITLHNDEIKYNTDTKVLPLFNTVNVMEMAGQEYGTLFSSPKGLEVHFTLEKDLKNARLRYITTGHGGWENGDEYLPKKNTIKVDGQTVFAFVPWRQDCGTYRLYNPASGNFENGLSSSDYSRSNWCPGTVTNPEYIDLGDLRAGEHTMTITIPMGVPEGSNFSAWNVSGVLLGRE